MKRPRYPRWIKPAPGSVWTLPVNYFTTFDKHWHKIMSNHNRKKKKLPKKLSLRLTRAMAEALDARLETGLYGKNLEEVANRLLCEALR